MEISNTVSRTSFPDTRFSSGLGYVHLPNPKDITRDDYIYDCLQNSHVTIYIEGEGQKHQVPVSVNLLNDLNFPKEYGKHGSRVIWVNDPLMAQIYVIAVLSSAPSYIRQEEHSFRLIRRFKDGFVEITGDANSSSVNMSAYSPKQARLSFSSTDLEDSSELEFRVTGSNTSKTSQGHKIISNLQVKLTVEDPKDDQKRSSIDLQVDKIATNTVKQSVNVLEDLFITVGEDQKTSLIKVDDSKITLETKDVQVKASTKVLLEAKKIVLGSEDQPMVLGDDLNSLLGSLIDEICNLIIITPTGPGSVNPASQVKLKLLKIKAKMMLSKVAFLE